MTSLLQWDEHFFHLVNVVWQNPFFDAVMPLLRNKYTWFPLYLFLLVFLLLNFRKKGIFILFALALAVGISDSVSSHLIKKNVRRVRPCKVYRPPSDIHLLVSCGSGYSFPSSHAANHFTMAVFLVLALGKTLPRLKIPLLLWAFSIAYAQVYVGLHYPVDVVAGAIFGSLVGRWMYGVTKFYLEADLPEEGEKRE